MHRATLCALAVWGTLSLAACDQPGTAPKLLATSAAATPDPRQSLSLPVHATGTAQLSGCNTRDGVIVALNGQLALPSLGARLTFYNNEKGTHGAVVQARGEASVIPAGATMTIPSQSAQSSVSGQPSFSLQLVDGGGHPLTSETDLGACGGSLALSGDFTLPATVRATVTSCQNNAGASLALSGALTIDAAVTARVTLRDGTSAASETTGSLQLQVVPDQETIQFAKQPVNGGVGGNPWIYLQFVDATGAPFGQEFLIGRCAQLT